MPYSPLVPAIETAEPVIGIPAVVTGEFLPAWVILLPLGQLIAPEERSGKPRAGGISLKLGSQFLVAKQAVWPLSYRFEFVMHLYPQYNRSNALLELAYELEGLTSVESKVPVKVRKLQVFCAPPHQEHPGRSALLNHVRQGLQLPSVILPSTIQKRTELDGLFGTYLVHGKVRKEPAPQSPGPSYPVALFAKRLPADSAQLLLDGFRPLAQIDLPKVRLVIDPLDGMRYRQPGEGAEPGENAMNGAG